MRLGRGARLPAAAAALFESLTTFLEIPLVERTPPHRHSTQALWGATRYIQLSALASYRKVRVVFVVSRRLARGQRTTLLAGALPWRSTARPTPDATVAFSKEESPPPPPQAVKNTAVVVNKTIDKKFFIYNP